LIEARAGADRIFIVVKFETKRGWTERWPEPGSAVSRDLPQALVTTPKIISQTVDATGWSKLAEITVD
jgi:hypothetical protein